MWERTRKLLMVYGSFALFGVSAIKTIRLHGISSSRRFFNNLTNGGSKLYGPLLLLAMLRIALFELTCPLERNIHTANNYKREKYSGMQSDLEDKGWKVYLVPYEVSSRGQILKTTKSSIIYTLKQFKIKIKAEQLLFKQLSKIALLSTFSIFHAYQTKEWVSPPLLRP